MATRSKANVAITHGMRMPEADASHVTLDRMPCNWRSRPLPLSGMNSSHVRSPFPPEGATARRGSAVTPVEFLESHLENSTPRNRADHRRTREFCYSGGPIEAMAL